MKTFIFSSILILSVMAISAQESLTGTWNTGQENTIVEIAQTDGVFSGMIVSSDNANAKIGATMLRDLQVKGDKLSAEIFAAKKGKWFPATIKEEADKLNITIEAGMMKKTVEWTKATKE